MPAGAPLLPGGWGARHGGLVVDEVDEVVEHVAAVVAAVVKFVEDTLYEVCVCSAAAARSWPCSKSAGRCLPKRKNFSRR